MYLRAVFLNWFITRHIPQSSVSQLIHHETCTSEQCFSVDSSRDIYLRVMFLSWFITRHVPCLCGPPPCLDMVTYEKRYVISTFLIYVLYSNMQIPIIPSTLCLSLFSHICLILRLCLGLKSKQEDFCAAGYAGDKETSDSVSIWDILFRHWNFGGSLRSYCGPLIFRHSPGDP
jgi:hypothetical protein